MPELKGGTGVTLRLAGTDLFIDGYDPVNSSTTVFVDKNGSDTNDGLTNEAPKLTIGSAMTAAAALIAGGETTVLVYILGSDTFSESFTVPGNVILLGQAATIVGSITIQTSSRVIIYAHYASEINQNMLLKTGASGGWYTTFISDGRGTAGNLTGTVNVKSETEDSILYIDTALMFVAASGYGVTDESPGFGHIHVNIKDLYLAGNDAIGMRFQGGASDGVGYIDHILELTPGYADTVGISVGATSIAKIIGCEIKADTAYTIQTAGVNTGELYLICPKVTGITVGDLSNA